MNKHPTGTVYILEFSRPLSHARYYVGWTRQPIAERLAQHRNGQGAKITRAAVAQGISLKLIYTTTGTRHDERAIKNRKNTPRYVASLRRRGLIKNCRFSKLLRKNARIQAVLSKLLREIVTLSARTRSLCQSYCVNPP